jgi:hypothetical protein
MKVYDTNLTGASAAEAARTQDLQKLDRTGSGKSSPSGGVGGADSVELSGALGRLSQTLSTFHQDRASRVQALAAQYQSGNYRPDSLATSRAMISDALNNMDGKAAGLE